MIIENVEQFNGTLKKFLLTITSNRNGYLRKKGAHNVYKFWWDKDDDWFLHVAKGKVKTNSYGDSNLIIRKDVENNLNVLYINQGYIMYIDKEIDKEYNADNEQKLL